LTPEAWQHGVDADEVMMRREVHTENLFPTYFTPEEVRSGLGEDDKLAWWLHSGECDIGFTSRHKLNFYFGGAFTAELKRHASNQGN